MKVLKILDKVVYRWIKCIELSKFKLAQKEINFALSQNPETERKK